MATVLSPRTKSQSPSPSNLPPRSTATADQDIDTSPAQAPGKAQSIKAPSYASKRLSTFSTNSNSSTPRSNPRSRPVSLAFPQFHSTLPYALVRDFAYPAQHPCHYGPQPEEPSTASTPRSDIRRRLSDPEPAWERSESWESWRQSTGEQLPQTTFGNHDGPPWSEDEDLQSPVVTSSRHKKNRSNHVGFDATAGRHGHRESEGRRLAPKSGEDHDSREMGDQQGAIHHLGPPAYPVGRRDSHFATSLSRSAYPEHQLSSSPGGASEPREEDEEEEAEDSSMDYDTDDNRYSRDYQFTIASPDEEMHGRAVALFDFASENDNELALVEGQVILISYRHGQGWLVAQDPKTGESGLVPEEYVRLLRDIEGGLSGFLNGWANANNEGDGANHDDSMDPHHQLPNHHSQSMPMTGIESADAARTPTQSDHSAQHWSSRGLQTDTAAPSAGATGETSYYPPVISTFSTSREDFEPHPARLMSQVQTPTGTTGPELLSSRKSGDAERVESPQKLSHRPN